MPSCLGRLCTPARLRPRRLCTMPPPPPPPPRALSPPFPLRVALVGSSVGLATPLYVLGGLVVGWYRLLPQSIGGQWLRTGISALVGGGITTITYHYAAPFLQRHADLVQPFALASGTTAAVWYSVLEARFGIEFLAGHVSLATVAEKTPAFIGGLLKQLGPATTLRLPVGGVAIGLLTGCTAPFLWPSCVRLCWPIELQEAVLGARDASHLVDIYLSWLLLPVGLPVSVVAGVGMQSLLGPVLLPSGPAPLPWTSTALPLLCAILGAGILYFSVCRPTLEDLFWERRIDVVTRQGLTQCIALSGVACIQCPKRSCVCAGQRSAFCTQRAHWSERARDAQGAREERARRGRPCCPAWCGPAHLDPATVAPDLSPCLPPEPDPASPLPLPLLPPLSQCWPRPSVHSLAACGTPTPPPTPPAHSSELGLPPKLRPSPYTAALVSSARCTSPTCTRTLSSSG